MPTVRTEPILFRSNGEKNSTPASLQTTEYNDKDRLKRALMRLGLFWLLAIASLPIIFAHWVLVPGFIIAGPVIAVMVYRTKETKDHATGLCPTCNESISIKLEAKDVIPKWTYCPKCNNPLHLDNLTNI